MNCLKCGNQGIIAFHADDTMCSRLRIFDGKIYVYAQRYSDEHLHFVCRNCGFEWQTEPLDHFEGGEL